MVCALEWSLGFQSKLLSPLGASFLDLYDGVKKRGITEGIFQHKYSSPRVVHLEHKASSQSPQVSCVFPMLRVPCCVNILI